MLDLVVLVLIAGLLFAGYRRGALVSLIAIVAIVAVAALAALLGASVAGRPGAVSAAMVAGSVTSLVLASRLRGIEEFVGRAVPEVWRQVDRPIGAIANALVGVGLVWCICAVASLVPAEGGMAERIRTSRSADLVLTLGSPTSSVAALVLRSGLVPALEGPVIVTDPPSEAVLSAPAVRAAAASVVKIEGLACDARTTGTGWVAMRQLVVTNAHVVAGHRRTWVHVQVTGARYPATVVGFDALNDVAVLLVPGLPLQPLKRNASPRHGEPGATIGFPGQFEQTTYPARFDRVVEWPVRDIYDGERRPVQLGVLRGEVHEGNSGSPVVDVGGRVIGTVTARAVGQTVDGAYAVPEVALAQILSRPLHGAVSTGRCIDNHGPREL